MIGQTITHYRILERLGEGGMGVVYKAEDLRLKRFVALKFLPPETTSDPETKTRLIREAQAASATDHPNLGTVYEIDQTDDGQQFIAMAYYEGDTLRERIARGPLPVREAVGVAEQIAEGLAKAHEQRIVHRDVKPANIFLTDDGLVKIMDFGLAKLPDPATRAAEDSETAVETIAGTSAYMSPEAVRGEEVDQRTDLWSLGVVLYEMITGQLPFQGDYDRALHYGVIYEEPTLVSTLCADVPPELDKLVTQALTKQPAERYQNAAAMRDDLRTVRASLDRRDVAADPDADAPAVTAPARRPRRRWLQAVSITTLVAAATIVGILVFTPGQSVPFSKRDWILITDFENQTGEEIFQGTIREALSIDLQQSQYVNVFGGKRLTDALYRSGRHDTETIDADLGREIAVREGITAVLEGSVRKIGNSYLLGARLVIPATGDAVDTKRVEAKNIEGVIAALDELSRNIRRNLGESLLSIGRRDKPLAQVSTTSMNALQFYTLGMNHTREAKWEEAIPLFVKAIEADSTFAAAYYSLAVLYNNLLRKTDALRYSALAREHTKHVTEREKYHIEAEYFRIRGDYAEAIRQYRVLLEVYPDDFNAHNNLCFTYQFTRQYPEALAQAEEIARVDPGSWYARHNAALAHAGQGDYDAALEYFDLALQINAQAYWSRIGKSWVYALTDAWEQAWAELERSVPPGTEWQAIKEASYARLLSYRGDRERVIEHKQASITAFRSLGNRYAEAWILATLGEIQLTMGDEATALANLEQAARLRPDAAVLMFLGRGYAQQGAFAQAERTADRLAALCESELTKVNRANLHHLRGQIALYRGSHREAADELAMSLSYADFLETRMALGSVFFELGRYTEARELLTYVAEHQWACFFDEFPEYGPLALYQLGLVCEAEGTVAQAVEYYDQFLRLWQDGGAGRPEVKDARQRLEALASI